MRRFMYVYASAVAAAMLLHATPVAAQAQDAQALRQEIDQLRKDFEARLAALESRLGKAMVFVTHDVREGLLLATRIGLLDGGRLLFLGTPDEFRASPLPEVRQFMAAA